MTSWPRLVAEALGVPYGDQGSWERRIAEGLQSFNGGDIGALDTGSVWLGRLWRALEAQPNFDGRTWPKMLAGGGWRELYAAIQNQPEPEWTPADLGAKLIAWWDAEDADTLTLSGGLAVEWIDKVNGITLVQSLAGQRPVYSDTSFGGRPALSFDGLDDFLAVTPAHPSIPIGGDPCEMWALVDQLAPEFTDSGQRMIMSYGSGTMDRRGIFRANSLQVNSFTVVGTRNTNGVVASVAGGFSGKHVVRGRWTGSQMYAQRDETISAPTALAPLTTGARFRLGAGPNAAANAFHMGGFNSGLITTDLDEAESASLLAYLANRIPA